MVVGMELSRARGTVLGSFKGARWLLLNFKRGVLEVRALRNLGGRSC